MRIKRWLIILFASTFLINASKKVTLTELINPDSIAADLDKIYITEGTSIFIYDLNNFKFVKKFGKTGEGPKEFMRNPQSGNPPLSIDVSTDYIVVNSYNKLSFFLKNGEFKSEQKINTNSNGFIPLDKGFAGETLSTQDGTRYWILDIYDVNLFKVKQLSRIKHHFQGVGKGFKVFQESRLYTAYDNKLFVAWEKDFNIKVFDSGGRVLYIISCDYKKLPVTKADKEELIKYFKTDPKSKELYPFIKPIIFPDYYPAIRSIKVNNRKIYTITYNKRNSVSECYIFNLAGKLLKKVDLELKATDLFALYPFTISNGKIYQLTETEDEAWEILISLIN